MPDGNQIDFAAHIEAVARRLCGEPNQQRSTRRTLRFGTNGSLAVEIGGDNRGTYYDHENKVGGGTLDLIRNKLGVVNGGRSNGSPGGDMPRRAAARAAEAHRRDLRLRGRGRRAAVPGCPL